MNRASLAVLFTLATAPGAHAASIEYTAWGGQELWQGFSPDGLYFVFGSTNDVCVVMNTRTGHADELEGDRCASFIKSNKVQPVKPSRTSPDGKSKAEVQLVKQGEGTWKDNVYVPAATASAQLFVERDGKKTLSADWRAGLVSLDAYWSPNGQKVAWVGRANRWQGMDGSHQLTLVTGSAGPRVRVVADKSLLGKPAEAAAIALEGKGLAPGFIGKALKARETSVVYFAEGFEDAAKQAAEALPGGATTEKLTWPAAAELVVALGKTARGEKR